ncbi:MAG: 6,7-dimethyl-8-ribityllumazine synthase [Rhodospirillales bacterium]|jgi:6,7-dimethyl-8-ribityllumazine synthase|nr:6,7-dimethyl-8-ribityllumazine synthase [Rhodospirillales bacterium]
MTDGSQILIVEARFYEKIADALVTGASQVLDQAGVAYTRMSVPGTFEVPALIRFAIRSMEVGAAVQRYSGFIALGCVIRGETDHYDHICREATRALMEISTTYSVALGFGILTCDTYEQAWERADVGQKNKGADAARACLKMMEHKRSLRLVIR